MRIYRLQHASVKGLALGFIRKKHQKYKKTPFNIPNHEMAGSVAGFKGAYLDSDQAKVSKGIRSLGNKRARN